MNQAIERFIRYLATERGLSDNYQISVRRSLERLADWLAEIEKLLTGNKFCLNTSPISSLNAKKRDSLPPVSGLS